MIKSVKEFICKHKYDTIIYSLIAATFIALPIIFIVHEEYTLHGLEISPKVWSGAEIAVVVIALAIICFLAFKVFDLIDGKELKK